MEIGGVGGAFAQARSLVAAQTAGTGRVCVCLDAPLSTDSQHLLVIIDSPDTNETAGGR